MCVCLCTLYMYKCMYVCIYECMYISVVISNSLRLCYSTSVTQALGLDNWCHHNFCHETAYV